MQNEDRKIMYQECLHVLLTIVRNDFYHLWDKEPNLRVPFFSDNPESDESITFGVQRKSGKFCFYAEGQFATFHGELSAESAAQQLELIAERGAIPSSKELINRFYNAIAEPLGKYEAERIRARTGKQS